MDAKNKPFAPAVLSRKNLPMAAKMSTPGCNSKLKQGKHFFGANARVCGEQPLTRIANMVFLQITLKVEAQNRPAAAEVYSRYREPFLQEVPGARSKQLLVRDEDVQVLHAFDNREHAQAYLTSALFTSDVVVALKPLLVAEPDVRIYDVA